MHRKRALEGHWRWWCLRARCQSFLYAVASTEGLSGPATRWHNGCEIYPAVIVYAPRIQRKLTQDMPCFNVRGIPVPVPREHVSLGAIAALCLPHSEVSHYQY